MASPRIQLLSDSLSNQIAAGEVIQRPASVVKELIENSLDAQSKHIKLIIKDAGKELIQVLDDGIGMTMTDARMCFEKHATSKISSIDDLFNLHTMGFRGEALASIAAIAQVVMETYHADSDVEVGTSIHIEGSVVQSQKPIVMPPGTHISVKNLFFNVPARRNFLKSNTIETKHIIELFQRIALSRPDVHFDLYKGKKEIYQLPATKLSHRIVHLFGKSYQEQLIPCKEETELLTITGYIGKPSHAKKTRGEQFFFVNKRFIKSNALHHAVKSAFSNVLPDAVFPFYVLFIDIAPDQIDVNIHPTKTEIKFEDERIVYTLLKSVIRKALAVYHVVPSIDFNQNANLDFLNLQKQDYKSPKNIVHGVDKDYTQFKHTHVTSQHQADDWQKLCDKLDNNEINTTKNSIQPSILTFSSDANTDIKLAKESSTVPLHNMNMGTAKIQIQDQYIIVQVKSGILFIDQQAAHERIIYDQYQQLTKNKMVLSQQLLLPQTIILNPADFSILHDCIDTIRTFGFELSITEKNTISVVGCPTNLETTDIKALLESILEIYKLNQTQGVHTHHENWLRSFAKKTCIQKGKKLDIAEINSLIDQLFACHNTQYAPDGRKICMILSFDQIDTLFQQ